MSFGLDEDDRRRESRIKFHAPYRINVDGGTYVGTLDNITKNGAFLSGGSAFIPSSCVTKVGDLYITVGERELAYKAQIVYVQYGKEGPFHQGAGVMFTETNGEHAGLLEKLIADYQQSKIQAENY